MALQNRVDPFGEIHAVSARGALMGNRGGCLHTPGRQLTGRRWVSARWIACRLEFRGWHREVMQPGRYTELFFIDEATAFAAGHRPCMLCRNAEARRFAGAWLAGNPNAPPLRSVDALDRALHAERVDPITRRQRTRRAPVRGLPDGAMITLDAGPGAPLLVWGGALWPWSFDGYRHPLALEEPVLAGEATLLTPPSVVEAFRAGYRPAVHPSCRALTGRS
jgi:hypothetical protein